MCIFWRKKKDVVAWDNLSYAQFFSNHANASKANMQAMLRKREFHFKTLLGSLSQLAELICVDSRCKVKFPFQSMGSFFAQSKKWNKCFGQGEKKQQLVWLGFSIHFQNVQGTGYRFLRQKDSACQICPRKRASDIFSKRGRGCGCFCLTTTSSIPGGQSGTKLLGDLLNSVRAITLLLFCVLLAWESALTLMR